MKSVADIRSTFLNYFKDNNHEIVPSSSLVPSNDPTLLFTNAGMVPFKNVFTGAEKRDYTRATSSQKCVRAGGKHNDLENVGHTARHHTFFEMLGNFSFGDYFKEDAIPLAWNLITKEYGLSAEKLLITVYSEDEEAASIWKKVTGFSDSKIIRIPTADNFWSMGPTGPCGPCSEIFYDHGDHIPGGPPGSPDEDGDRFIEIWNLVFMQYEQIDADTRVDLPKPSIDTGMGLERISAVLQGTHDNYETDLFKTLINASSEITGSAESVSHRVIADHLRSSAFLIADGVTPSNEGRGYVLRRIMRRAMRHVHILGYDDCLMHQLVSTLANEMGHAYPELNRAEAFITETLKLEEERFKRTLGRGLKLLQEEETKLSATQTFPGDVAFKLYDTYGFPLDLTQDVLKQSKRDVDLDTFDACMEKQRQDARASWSGSGQEAESQVWFDLQQKLGASEFLGYETLDAEGQITAIVKDGAEVSIADQVGESYQILINQTPFYAESGGQSGDAGTIKTPSGVFQVQDVKKMVGNLHVHMVTLKEGTVAKDDVGHAAVQGHRRDGLKIHHSATHLLHQALRRQLGDHVVQKGSYVGPDKLRFDFSYNASIPAEDLHKIEDAVNTVIRRNAATETHMMKPDEAIEKGALALFGEKYGDEVRVVSMGDTSDEGTYSVELCGGTHVHRTGEIGYFKIISESGIAAGIRRIEALAGAAAENYMRDQERRLIEAADLLKSRPSELIGRIKSLQDDRKSLEKKVKDLKSNTSSNEVEVQTVNGINFAYQLLNDVEARDLKPMVDQLKKKIQSGVAVAITGVEGKASIVVGVTEDMTAKINAVNLVRVGSEVLGGKGGGGRPDMAQAGGSDPSQAKVAIQAIMEQIELA